MPSCEDEGVVELLRNQPVEIVNPFTPNGMPHSYQLDQSISVLRGFGVVFFNLGGTFFYFIQI